MTRGKHRNLRLTTWLVGAIALGAMTSVNAGPVSADDLATANLAGACGVLDSLLEFQKKTKLSGSDEFVAKFWTAEAARLGLSMPELSSRCLRATAHFNRLSGSGAKK